MTRSEQTVARIGRVMKSCENTSAASSGWGPAAAVAGRCGRRERLHRRTVGDLLNSSGNQLVTGLETRRDDVLVADHRPQRDLPLPGDEGTVLAWLRDEREVLAADPHRRDDRHRHARYRAPDDPRLNELVVAKLTGAAHGRFREHGLRLIVDRGRHEADTF